MSLKRAAALIANASMALAATAVIAPTATAQDDPVTETVSVDYTCRGNAPGNAPGSPRDVTVTFPESVDPGEVFTVTLAPGVMRNNSRNHARFTYDVALPDNAHLVDSRLVTAAQNMGGTPSLTRADPQTKVNQADGNTLRIWGGASARWGTNNGTGTSGGLTVSSNQDFRFPTVEMTFRAPPTPGTEIAVGLAGTGPNDTAAGAQIMYSGHTGGLFGSNFQNECSASPNTGRLTATTVADADYVSLASTTRIVGGDQLADSSVPVTLRAQVASPYARIADLTQGTVTFRDVDADIVLGSAPPNEEGFAEIAYEFDRIPDDEPDVGVNVVAEYSGFEGELIHESIAPSSDSNVLTLTPKPVVQWATGFTVSTTFGQLTEESLPVTVTAEFQRPGLEFPESTVVQLYRDGEALGEPVPMPADATSLTWQDEVPRTERNATYRYTVELETIRVEYDQWTGSTAQPSAVIVAGRQGPGTTPEPDPATGSLDGGSAELGTLSSDLIGYDVAPLSMMMPELTIMLSSETGSLGS